MSEPRVLDLSVDLSGMYAARLLADQGWLVKRVDLPSDSELRSLWRENGAPATNLEPIDYHLNRNKDRSELDFSTPDGWNALRTMGADADVIIESFPATTPAHFRLTFADLKVMNPKATVVSISPYGRIGPYSSLLATEKTLWAHSGAMFLCGRLEREPMAPSVPIVSFLGGIYGCIAVLAEVIRRKRTGAKLGRHLDVALMDVMSANLERATTYYSYLQCVPLRGSASRRYFGGYPAGPYEARDGYLMLVPGHQPVSSVALLVEQPELIDHPLFNDRPRRIREAAAFDDLIRGPLAERSVDDLVRDAAELRMPCARILEIPDLFKDEQLRHREAITEPAPGMLHIQEPWRWISVEPVDDSHTPVDGANHDLDGNSSPLAGIRVLDLTKAYAGPTASRILAELGAEVIKVESTDHLDIVPRGLIPCDNQPGDEWWERSGFFADRNLGKLGITLKLDVPEGRDLALRLVEKSDVAIWNFSPRVMDNLDLPFETLRSRNPNIVLTAMSGYGYAGPGRDQYALAATMEAASGWTSQMRYSDGDVPMLLGFSLLDALSGIYAAAATLFALETRLRTGQGATIDFAARESAIPFLAFPLTESLAGREPSVEVDYLTPNGQHVALRTHGQESWVLAFVPEGQHAEFIKALAGNADKQARPDSWRKEAEALAQGWEQAPLVAELQRRKFAAAPLPDGGQVLLDKHLAERQIFHLVDRPTGVGLRPHARQFPVLANGIPISAELGSPPRVGEHNRRVYMDLLRLPEHDIQQLMQTGVIGDGPASRLPGAWKQALPLEEMEEQGAIRRVPDAVQRIGEHFGATIGPRQHGRPDR